MTSDPPHQQWTDLYKESVPDGVGAMGGEEVIGLVVLHAATPAQAPSTPLRAVSAEPSPPPARWFMHCGAGRLLSAESTAGIGRFLGLCDDVDCAVVGVSWRPQDQEPKVSHERYVPALAYVAAGKVHKKHLLIGNWNYHWSWPMKTSSFYWIKFKPSLLGAPDALISAVLVESQRFYYVYHRTGPRDAYGLQDVVDMELEDGETVLGARLIDLGAEDSASLSAASPAVGTVLLLVTRTRLLVHFLCNP